MKIQNKTRFTCFIIALMIVSGVAGYFIGLSAYANTCETVSEEPLKEPEPPEEVEPVATIEFEDLGVYTLTAYCGCEKCCGKKTRPVDENGNAIVKGAGGVELVEGIHCASPLPLGTVVEIEGLGAYEVQDRTAQFIVDRYDGKIIDIYFENHEDAQKFGKQTARVKEVKKL